MDYLEIVSKRLKITDEFLTRYRETILQSIVDATSEPSKSDPVDCAFPADLVAVNQALHLAGSVMLLGSSSHDLRGVAEEVAHQPAFRGLDPTTVLAVAVLYYLVQFATSQPVDSSVRQKIQSLHKYLDQVNWLTGVTGMAGLGIQPLERQLVT